jgi:hypothetical protein
MNRRSFLKSVLSAAVLAQTNIESVLDNIILESEHLSDDEFVTYMTIQMNLWVDNPKSCAIITDIGEE